METGIKKAALLDLDGTLLPMDTAQFMMAYTNHIAKCVSSWGIGLEPQELVEAIWRSTGAIAQSKDESSSNEDVFWQHLNQLTGVSRQEGEAYFRRYYMSNFSEIQVHCGFQPLVYDLLRDLRAKGYALAIATNPVFPRIAIEKRLTWAGIQDEPFALITDFESSRSAKPQAKYYLDVLEKLGAIPGNCLMIGNDARDDIIPTDALGLRCYMVTDCAMNQDQLPAHVANGNFNMLLRWVRALPEGAAETEMQKKKIDF